MACFAETGNWNVAMFCVALFAAVIAFASEWLRQYWNRTKISLKFEPPKEKQGPYFGCVYWISNTPKENGVKNAVWVRMRVKNEGRLLARLCLLFARLCRSSFRLHQPSVESRQPFLTTIERKDKNGKYKEVHRDMLQLHWAFRDGEKEPAIDIPGEWEAYCDVFQTIEGVHHFQPRTVAQPVTWQQCLNQGGEYRLEVAVNGDNIEPQKKYLYIKWAEKWDDFKIAGNERGDFTRISWDGSSNQDNKV